MRRRFFLGSFVNANRGSHFFVPVGGLIVLHKNNYQSMENRLTYLDCIKGLGIILVILYHCGYVPWDSMYIRGIYAICVPLFFMVNGYVMLRKEHSLKTLLSKNVKIIFIALFWACVSTAIYMWKIGEWNMDTPLDSIKIFVKKSWYMSTPYSNHLWFLETLFVLNLLNPIWYYFIHYKKNGIYYLLLLFGLCTPLFIGEIMNRLFINPFRGWYWFSILYYVLGYALLDGHLNTDKIKTNWIIVISLLLTLCQFGYNWCINVGPLASHQWINDIVWDGYSAPFVILLTASVCWLFKRIKWKENGFLQSIGLYSLPIYLMQTPVQRLWQMALPLDIWKQNYHICGIILPILTLITCYFLARLLLTNKYTTWLVKI